MANDSSYISGSQAFSNPQTSPVYSWKQYARYFYPAANAYRNFAKGGGEQSQLYQQFKDAYLSPEAQANASENAKIYGDYTKNLFANQPNQFQNYQQVGDYLFGKFNDFRDTTAASGLRDMNSRLALLGIRPGSTGYDRLLNANRITNNLAPAYATTVNAIGRDYSGINQNQFNDTMLRLGLANQDALGGYMNNVYTRPLDVADVRYNQIRGNTQVYNDLANSFKTNVAGYQTKEGNDIARFGSVWDNYWNGYYSSYNQAGQRAGNQGTNVPFQQTQQSNPYLGQIQDNQWMREYNGMSGNPYAGQVSPYTGGYDNYPITSGYSAPVGDYGTGFDASAVSSYA